MDKSTVAITVQSYLDGCDFEAEHFMSDYDARECVKDAMHDDCEVDKAIELLQSRGFGVHVDKVWMSIAISEYKDSCFEDIVYEWEQEAREYVDIVVKKLESGDEEYLAFFEGVTPDDKSTIEYVLIKYGMYQQLKGECHYPDADVFDDLVTDFSKPEVYEDYKAVMSTYPQTTNARRSLGA